jgi:hypothetical protein
LTTLNSGAPLNTDSCSQLEDFICFCRCQTELSRRTKQKVICLGEKRACAFSKRGLSNLPIRNTGFSVFSPSINSVIEGRSVPKMQRESGKSLI